MFSNAGLILKRSQVVAKQIGLARDQVKNGSVAEAVISEGRVNIDS